VLKWLQRYEKSAKYPIFEPIIAKKYAKDLRNKEKMFIFAAY